MGLGIGGIPAAVFKPDIVALCRVQNTQSEDPVCGGFLGSDIDEPFYARYRFYAAEEQAGTAAGVAGMAYDDDLQEEEQQAVRPPLVPGCIGATSEWHRMVATRGTVQRALACLVEHGSCAVQVPCAAPKQDLLNHQSKASPKHHCCCGTGERAQCQ